MTVFPTSCGVIKKIKTQWFAIIFGGNKVIYFFFLRDINALTRSFASRLLLLTALCRLSPSPQTPPGRCCWPTSSRSQPALPSAASSRRAPTSSACVPSTTSAEASSAKRRTGGCLARRRAALRRLITKRTKSVEVSVCEQLCVVFLAAVEQTPPPHPSS